MIFVVLGTQRFHLNRLLKALDKIIEQGLLNEKVVAQIGYSDYIPKNYSYDRFFNKQLFDEHIKQCDLLITHSGVGSIITGVTCGKPVIVYPRLAKYHEHVDDHQLDIAKAFEKKQYVLCCYEEDDLVKIIERSKNFSFQTYCSQRERIEQLITNYIHGLEEEHVECRK